MLPGPRIFRSRWFALLWAGSMVWLAIDVSGTDPTMSGAKPATDQAGSPIDAADLNTVAGLIGNAI